MFQTRASSAALASGLALLLGSAAVVVTPGLAAAQVQAGGTIQRILVQGNERIEQSTVVSYLPMQQGETVDAAKADLAVKALYRTELFSNVTIAFQNGDLIVTVVENPIINRVIFEGNKGLKRTSCATRCRCARGGSSPARRCRATSRGSWSSTGARAASRPM